MPNSLSSSTDGAVPVSQSKCDAAKASASAARRGVGPAEPIPVPTVRAVASIAKPNEHTAITIALRVPIFEYC